MPATFADVLAVLTTLGLDDVIGLIVLISLAAFAWRKFGKR